jgi:hypothetical protein
MPPLYVSFVHFGIIMESIGDIILYITPPGWEAGNYSFLWIYLVVAIGIYYGYAQL